jgi:hypothetical protein
MSTSSACASHDFLSLNATGTLLTHPQSPDTFSLPHPDFFFCVLVINAAAGYLHLDTRKVCFGDHQKNILVTGIGLVTVPFITTITNQSSQLRLQLLIATKIKDYRWGHQRVPNW